MYVLGRSDSWSISILDMMKMTKYAFTQIPDLSFTMTEEEQEEGMTLLCMARPVSDRVVIETQSDWGYSLGVAEWKGATGEINGKKVEPLMGKKWDN